jgi:hypothetical protein
MKMKHMLKFIFSFYLLLFSFFVQAQQNTPLKNPTDLPKTEGILPIAPKQIDKKPSTVVKTDSVPTKMNRYGLRVGVDLYRLTRSLYDSDYKGIELVGDYRFTKNYYLAAEIGSEEITTEDTRLTSTAKGTYLKAGFDYNLYENWLNMENIISIGLRYGMSTFNQQLDSYKTYNPNPYWGELPSTPSGENFSGLTAGWVEVIAGLKVKVINNIFVGFSLRMNTLLFNTKPNNFENLYIPGFNRTYDGNFGAGFNYTVTYFVPLYKKKAVAKKKP